MFGFRFVFVTLSAGIGFLFFLAQLQICLVLINWIKSSVWFSLIPRTNVASVGCVFNDTCIQRFISQSSLLLHLHALCKS